MNTLYNNKDLILSIKDSIDDINANDINANDINANKLFKKNTK